MSTKIHSGFLFNFSFGFGYQTALEELQALRKELLPVSNKLFGKLLTQEITCSIDAQHKPGVDSSVRLSYGAAVREIRKRQKDIRATGYRDPEVDLGFDVSIVPLNGGKLNSFLLGLYFTEQAEFIEALKAKPWFSDYSYWNNTDRPDDVSKTAWAQRKRDWNRALGHDAPSERGLSFTVISNDLMLFPKPEDLVQLQPSIEKRASSIAKNLLFASWHKGKEVTGANSVSLIMEFEMEMLHANAPRRAEYDQLKAEWESKLKPLTLEDLKEY